MVEKRRSNSTGTFEITNVRKGNGPNEYIVTVTRNGRPTGDVKVRASSSAPAYFNDVTGKIIVESTGQ